MTWITRERVKVDRVACPWLIRKNVEMEAEFLFVPKDQVQEIAQREGAIPFDVEGMELPGLLRAARAEWSALTWLCWSVGLDRVALPAALSPPPDFGKACGMSVERLWRCEDKVITGGLRALSQKVPGFSWEGIAVDELPPLLAEIATDDYRELRALFFWLCDAGVQSLWQDNLRGNA